MAICYKTRVHLSAGVILIIFRDEAIMKIIFGVISTELGKSISYYKLIAAVLMTIMLWFRFLNINGNDGWRKKENLWQKIMTKKKKMMSVHNDDIGDEWRFTSDSGNSCSRKPHVCHHVTSALVGSRSNNIMTTMIHVSDHNDVHHCKINHASCNYTSYYSGCMFIRVWWTMQ